MFLILLLIIIIFLIICSSSILSVILFFISNEQNNKQNNEQNNKQNNEQNNNSNTQNYINEKLIEQEKIYLSELEKKLIFSIYNVSLDPEMVKIKQNNIELVKMLNYIRNDLTLTLDKKTEYRKKYIDLILFIRKSIIDNLSNKLNQYEKQTLLTMEKIVFEKNNNLFTSPYFSSEASLLMVQVYNVSTKFKQNAEKYNDIFNASLQMNNYNDQQVKQENIIKFYNSVMNSNIQISMVTFSLINELL